MKVKMIYMFAVLGLLSFAISGCSEGDGDKDYGFAFVYMPQAAGISDYYAVPSGEGEYTYNFRVQDGKVEVILGVTRSGDVKDRAFSVTVNAETAAAQYFVDGGSVAGAQLMPASIYTLPSSAAVEDGKNSGSFYLSVDVPALLSGTYDGQKLVMAVSISNPTRYELADTNTTTVIVLDVDAIQEFL